MRKNQKRAIAYKPVTLSIGYILAAVISLGSIMYPLIHQSAPALPTVMENYNVSVLPDNAEATTGAFLQAVFFLTTISFGLTAAAFVFCSGR